MKKAFLVSCSKIHDISFILLTFSFFVSAGSFTIAFDFDECGNGGVNYCQQALINFDQSYNTIICTPTLASDYINGGDHCVSQAIFGQSFSSSVEGDPGTLQYALISLQDDNGNKFMNITGMPGKESGVTVTRESKIKTKSNCTINDGYQAQCHGKYEILYKIEFDAYHTSGDMPELTIMHSDIKVNVSSPSFESSICPQSKYSNGCESPVGNSLDSSFGSFYENSYLNTAVESTKGNQPDGTISLTYECESKVHKMVNGSMTTDKNTGLFSDPSFTLNMMQGQWIRFSASEGIDFYRKLISIDKETGNVTFDEAVYTNTSYSDVEYGDYFSDWSESDGTSGISDICRSSRIHTTLPIDISIQEEVSSIVDWESKLKGLTIIDSTGIEVSRRPSNFSKEIGFIWAVTFLKQPGNINEMVCNSLSGSNICNVYTATDGSMLSGFFRLQTTWPHEYSASSPKLYETAPLPWNIGADTLKEELETVSEGVDKVFGTVDVTRTSFTPSAHLKWSGGYLWTITFTSREGNIPATLVKSENITGFQPTSEIADENSGQYDTYQGLPNNYIFLTDDPGTARDGNQVSGSFALSWIGNEVFHSVVTLNIFQIQTGGVGSERFTAMSAQRMHDLLSENIFANNTDIINVSRSILPSQALGYTYFVTFRHEDVGGDLSSMALASVSELHGYGADVLVAEYKKGAEILGTFQLRFEGETTRPLAHNASANDVEDALNELMSISPSQVKVSRTAGSIKMGPADGIGGQSIQVGGFEWKITFSSNVWKDPNIVHNSSFVPGNWVGDAVDPSDTWSSGFSKAWGKNVGNVAMIECIDNGLYTTNGVLPIEGCKVSELVQGTDPLGGHFRICFDTLSIDNNVTSVKVDECSDFIDHNAPASVTDSIGDGSSFEEKLESMTNIGDVMVKRSDVNPRNGGYTWTITFLNDADGPCQQKDDVVGYCNAPGNVPKFCDPNGSSICDTSALLGSCSRPGNCTKLTVLDESDFLNNIRPPALNEIQVLYIKDKSYTGWKDGSVVETEDYKEYKLSINGISTSCLRHNASAEEVRHEIQSILNSSSTGTVRVERKRSLTDAPNGFMYLLIFYDTGNIPDIIPLFTSDSSVCAHGFSGDQQVSIHTLSDGDFHATDCDICKHGAVQRGNYSVFEVVNDNLNGQLPWNADADEVRAHLESRQQRFVQVSRKVMDKYGSIDWFITFVGNPGSIPPGAGDVDLMKVEQISDKYGNTTEVLVQEIQKGSNGLSGSFLIDYQSASGPREISFDEPAKRLSLKLNELSTIGHVYVTRDKYPSDNTGGWGAEPVSIEGCKRGGFQWSIYFVKNPGLTDGFSFPPGSGNMPTPSIDYSNMNGENVAVSISTNIDGSTPLSGNFKLKWGLEKTEPISYIASSTVIEKALNDLTSLGSVSVTSSTVISQKIPNITVNVWKDYPVIGLNGDDIRKHLAPGDMFRIGESEANDVYQDGSIDLGLFSVSHGSPLINSLNLNSSNIHVGEELRLSGDIYKVLRNGMEVQQIVVHRAKYISDQPFYQLRLSAAGVTRTTSCLNFDASSNDVEEALNQLSNVGDDGIFVTRSTESSGYIGDAHFYRIYFKTEKFAGNIEEIIAEYCSDGLPVGINSSNSHLTVKTIVEGGSIEHQQIILSSDSGYLEKIPAFEVNFTDQNSLSFGTGCLEWGEASLDLSHTVESIVKSSGLYIASSGVQAKSGEMYEIHTSGFVEGIIDIGDTINPGNSCLAKVISIGSDGRTLTATASDGCNAVSGDNIYINPDTRIIESFSGRQDPVFGVTKITIFSDKPVTTYSAIFRLQVTLGNESRVTSCLNYGVDANSMEKEIGQLFDYNKDGVINDRDYGHISVSREGDGSSSWAYGYVYHIESKGKYVRKFSAIFQIHSS